MSAIQNINKRIPKGDIKYKIQLSHEQKEAKTGIYEKDVTIIEGAAASGKTQFAVLCALDLLFKRQINQIIISRPIVKNKLGFLPGDTDDKMLPYIYPIKQCMYEAYDVAKIDKLFEEKVIQILPIDFMKGVTYLNSCVIIDEFQDLNMPEFELCLTRLGKDSKLIFTGSKTQIDISVGSSLSCIGKVEKLKKCSFVNYHEFKSNHRNDIIFKIMDYLK